MSGCSKAAPARVPVRSALLIADGRPVKRLCEATLMLVVPTVVDADNAAALQEVAGWQRRALLRDAPAMHVRRGAQQPSHSGR